MLGVEGKVVAITGASSGIGEATALLLAQRGAAVVLGARRGDRLDQLADRIRASGGRASTCITDVTKREDLDRLLARAVDDFGRLDVLVSNAGISKIGPMSDLDVEGWSAMMDVNVRGVLHGIAAALPILPTARPRTPGHDRLDRGPEDRAESSCLRGDQERRPHPPGGPSTEVHPCQWS